MWFGCIELVGLITKRSNVGNKLFYTQEQSSFIIIILFKVRTSNDYFFCRGNKCILYTRKVLKVSDFFNIKHFSRPQSSVN